MNKEDVEYTDVTPKEGQTCGNCEYLYKKVHSGSHICSWVAGEIKPQGWCNRWVKGD